MKVLLFGASGMVGQGVLLACLADPRVEAVTVVVRRALGNADPKVRELVHADFEDYSRIEADLTGFDACFFCLGVSAAGMSEADYRHVTYDYALAAGRTLARCNPEMAFIYVSGTGTDSAEQSRMMWARVKGKTENDLLKLPFRAAYMFRPGFIQPVGGVQSKTPLYSAVYKVFGVFYPALKAVAPSLVTSSDAVGRAMIAAVVEGGPSRVVETPEINRLAG